MMPAAMVKSRSCNRHGGGTFETSPVFGFGEVSSAPPPFDNGRKQASARSGTSLAIDNLTVGVAPHLPRKPGRGGARNRADRESFELACAQIANLTAAERHAALIGLPFTRMISIHWEAAGVPLSGMAAATGRFTDLMTRALARHGSRTAWLWSHENGERKGGHCHLLAHVPAELVPMLTRLQLGWLRRITLRSYRARVIYSRPIGGRLGIETSNPDLYAINLQVALQYVLKGASPEAASQFSLERLEPGGRIIGKRCGTSQNIGRKAREAAIFAHPPRARERN
jgi:hypothetical protein